MSVQVRCFHSMVALPVLIGLLALGVPHVCAEHLTDEELARAAAAREKKASAARDFVTALGLSRGQARRLLPLVEEAAWLYVDDYQQQAESLSGMVEAFGDFAREDSLNQGFSRPVERRTAGLNHRAKEAKTQHTEGLIALEEEAWGVLKPAQRQFVTAPAAKRGKAKGRRRKGDTNPLVVAQEELAALRRQVHPQVAVLGRHLFHPAAADVVCQVAGTSPLKIMQRAADVAREGTEKYPIERFQQHKAQVTRLRARINNWNLINGLYLSVDQIDEIVSLYDRAAPSLKPRKGKGKRGAGSRNSSLAALEQSVNEVLSPGQRQVLAEYKSCLLPPKNLKDPVRVGQANDSSRHERWLAKARTLSKKKLRQGIDQTIAKEEAHWGKLSPPRREARKTLLRRTVHRAAALSDVEFELNKAELAQLMAPHDRGSELKAEIDAQLRGRGLPGSVARFMLKPLFIEQLRQRGKQLAEGLTPKRADLAQGPQAEDSAKSYVIKTKAKTNKGRKGKDRSNRP